jgi:hypothetical protein
MFYEANSISNILTCPLCENKLDDPCVIPCGNSVCHDCIQEPLSEGDEDYECKLCNEKHNAKNFTKVNVFENLLILKPLEIYRGKTYQDFKQKLNQLKTESENLEDVLAHGNYAIKEHCNNLVNNIEMVTESKIEEINKNSQLLIDQVKEYEANCSKNLKHEQNFVEESKNKRIKLGNFCSEWQSYLNQAQIEHSKLQIGVSDLNENLSSLRTTQSKINEIFFTSVKLEFKPNEENLNTSILGSFNQSFVKKINSNNSIECCKYVDLNLVKLETDISNYSLISMDYFQNGGFIVLLLDKSNKKCICVSFYDTFMKPFMMQKKDLNLVNYCGTPKVLCINPNEFLIVYSDETEVIIERYSRAKLEYLKLIRLTQQSLKCSYVLKNTVFIMTSKNLKVYDQCLKNKKMHRVQSSELRLVKWSNNIEIVLYDDLIFILLSDVFELRIFKNASHIKLKNLSLKNMSVNMKGFGVLDKHTILFLSNDKNSIVIFDYEKNKITEFDLNLDSDFNPNRFKLIQNSFERRKFCLIDADNHEMFFFSLNTISLS